MLQLKKSLTKKTFDKEINDFYDFYRCVTLKEDFKDAANHQHLTKEGISQKPSSKSWIPSENTIR